VSDRLPTGARGPLCGLVAALAIGVAALGAVGFPVRAQEKQPAKEPDAKLEKAEFLDDAQHYTIRTLTKPEVVLKLHEAPLLNFTNPERNQECGSVFVWLSDGRPAVMGQFFRHDARRGRLKKHALHSLADVELEAKFRDKIAWTPDQPGVEWKSFPDAPAAGATQKERQTQLRQLARAVGVYLTDPKDREKPIELRRLERPLFEYSALKQGVTDGAIFSYVVATDPEAILLVECFDEKGKTSFRYALARFHFWALSAKLGNKTVWEVANDSSMVNNTIGRSETMKKVYNSFLP
jgi:hypothetical protein